MHYLQILSNPSSFPPQPEDFAMEKRETSVSRDEYAIDHVNSVVEDEKPQDNQQRDWTGTAKKTDPEEIKLVRKLDWWIMVSNIAWYAFHT